MLCKAENCLLLGSHVHASRLFPGSSAVEQPAVNRLVDGSNPSRGATFFQKMVVDQALRARVSPVGAPSRSVAAQIAWVSPATTSKPKAFRKGRRSLRTLRPKTPSPRPPSDNRARRGIIARQKKHRPAGHGHGPAAGPGMRARHRRLREDAAGRYPSSIAAEACTACATTPAQARASPSVRIRSLRISNSAQCRPRLSPWTGIA